MVPKRNNCIDPKSMKTNVTAITVLYYKASVLFRHELKATHMHVLQMYLLRRHFIEWACQEME